MHQTKGSPDFTVKKMSGVSSDHYLIHIDVCAGKDFLLSPEESLAASMAMKSLESGTMK